MATATSFPGMLKAGLWESGSGWQNFVSTPKHEPKFSVMLLCSLGLNESTQ